MTACPKLTELDLAECSGLDYVLLQSQTLRSVSLRKCGALTKASGACILWTLWITRNGRVPRPGRVPHPTQLGGLLRACADSSRARAREGARGTPFTRGLCTGAAHKAGRLTGCAGVGSRAQALLHCPRLNKLTITDCGQLTTLMLWTDELTELDLTGEGGRALRRSTATRLHHINHTSHSA
jgi:hypothetical protein